MTSRQQLALYEEKTGGRILAIPHNGNLSNGLMFPMIQRFARKGADREWATIRARWGPAAD